MPNNISIKLGQYNLDRKTCGKFLGVTLDEGLTFRDHVKHVHNKVSKLTELLSKLKNFFPIEILKNLYFSLIYPYLNYCILAWGAVQKTILLKLGFCQKKIVRILTNSDYLAHTKPLFKLTGNS